MVNTQYTIRDNQYELLKYAIRFTLHFLRTTNNELRTIFMQNKPNLREAQMVVTKVLTSDYDKRTLGKRGKNKPNSNPNKPNLLDNQMNVNEVLTKVCKDSRLRGSTENKPNLSRRSLWRSRIKPNSNPITKRPKMNVNEVLTDRYEDFRLYRYTQNKPNLSRRSLWRSRIKPKYSGL